MTAKGGHTLIEILIVFALFSIILGVTILNIGILDNIKENNELNELEKDLLFTRNKAIMENKAHIFYFDIVNNGYTIKSSENSPTIKSKIFESGIKITRIGETPTWGFTGSGKTSTSGSISIMNSKNETFKITLTPATGRVTISQAEKP